MYACADMGLHREDRTGLGAPWAWLGLCVLLSGCLNLTDPTGRRCDDANPCGGGRSCVRGYCALPGNEDESSEGGTGNNGPISDGSGATKPDGGSGEKPDGGPQSGAILFQEDFEAAALVGPWPNGTKRGDWTTDVDNDGTTQLENDGTRALDLSPNTDATLNERRVRVTSSTSVSDLDLTLNVKLVGLPSNSGRHRGASVLWHIDGVSQGYDLALSVTGWELFRRDPAAPGGLRSLAVAETFPISYNQPHTVRVRQVGGEIQVWLDGTPILSTIDPTPSLVGKLGLSAQDHRARFDNLSVVKP